MVIVAGMLLGTLAELGSPTFSATISPFHLSFHGYNFFQLPASCIVNVRGQFFRRLDFKQTEENPHTAKNKTVGVPHNLNSCQERVVPHAGGCLLGATARRTTFHFSRK